MGVSAIEVLVTVKAYPEKSAKYGEAVCVAGLRVDALLTPPSWVRLYPVQFRDMDQVNQFDKYDVIRIDATRSPNDTRPESWRPVTMEPSVLRKIGSENGTWRSRASYLNQVEHVAMCDLQRRQEFDGSSLGVFRPAEVLDVDVERKDEAEVAAAAEVFRRHRDQQSLFAPETPISPLEPSPYRFRYVYRCGAAGCSEPHRQMIVDWEIHQAYRSWRQSYGSDGAVQRIREKWLEQICGPTRDTRFFVGNMHQHRGSFLVLGTFWPKRS